MTKREWDALTQHNVGRPLVRLARTTSNRVISIRKLILWDQRLAYRAQRGHVFEVDELVQREQRLALERFPGSSLPMGLAWSIAPAIRWRVERALMMRRNPRRSRESIEEEMRRWL